MRTVLENYRKRGMRSEALQQVAQGQEGLIDHVDVVDDGACTGEDAGNVVEHLADVQEGLISVAGLSLIHI